MHAEGVGEGEVDGEGRLEHLQAVLELETKSRRQQQELNSKLQDEYDLLLKKLAQAELHIDQLRLGANVDINRRFILNHQVVRPRGSALLHQQDGSSSYSYSSHSAATGRGWEQAGNSSYEAPEEQDGQNPRHSFSLSFSGNLDDIAAESSPRYRHGNHSNNISPHQSLSDSNGDSSLSQMSAGYITTQASAESQHLSQVYQVRGLRESIATLKDKLASGQYSLEELSDDLGHILDEHGKLTENFSESTKQLCDLKQKYKDKASAEISRRKKTFEGELVALADQLKELDDLLRSKTTQNDDPAPPAPEPKEGAAGGELSDDSINSGSLPSRYLPKRGIDTSAETAQESTSHSPFSDIAGMESLSTSPEQMLQLGGSPALGEAGPALGSSTDIFVAGRGRFQQASGSRIPRRREESRINGFLAPQTSPASQPHPPAAPATPQRSGKKEGGSLSTTPFRSRIPLRVRRSGGGSTHNLPLYRSSPIHTPQNCHTPIKRNKGTIELRKSSSPAVLEPHGTEEKSLMNNIHRNGRFSASPGHPSIKIQSPSPSQSPMEPNLPLHNNRSFTKPKPDLPIGQNDLQSLPMATGREYGERGEKGGEFGGRGGEFGERGVVGRERKQHQPSSLTPKKLHDPRTMFAKPVDITRKVGARRFQGAGEGERGGTLSANSSPPSLASTSHAPAVEPMGFPTTIAAHTPAVRQVRLGTITAPGGGGGGEEEEARLTDQSLVSIATIEALKQDLLSLRDQIAQSSSNFPTTPRAPPNLTAAREGEGEGPSSHTFEPMASNHMGCFGIPQGQRFGMGSAGPLATGPIGPPFSAGSPSLLGALEHPLSAGPRQHPSTVAPLSSVGPSLPVGPQASLEPSLVGPSSLLVEQSPSGPPLEGSLSAAPLSGGPGLTSEGLSSSGDSTEIPSPGSKGSGGSLIPAQVPITLSLPNSDTSIPTPVSVIPPLERLPGLFGYTAAPLGAHSHHSSPRVTGRGEGGGGGGHFHDSPPRSLGGHSHNSPRSVRSYDSPAHSHDSPLRSVSQHSSRINSSRESQRDRKEHFVLELTDSDVTSSWATPAHPSTGQVNTHALHGTGIEPIPREIFSHSAHGMESGIQRVPIPSTAAAVQVTPSHSSGSESVPGVSSSHGSGVELDPISISIQTSIMPIFSCGTEAVEASTSTILASGMEPGPHVTPVHTSGIPSPQVTMSTQTSATELVPKATPTHIGGMDPVTVSISSQTSQAEFAMLAPKMKLATTSICSQTSGEELVPMPTPTHAGGMELATVTLSSQTNTENLFFKPTPHTSGMGLYPTTVTSTQTSLESVPKATPTHAPGTNLEPVSISIQTSLAESAPKMTPTHTSRLELVSSFHSQQFSPPLDTPSYQDTLSRPFSVTSRTDLVLSQSAHSSDYATALSSAPSLTESSYKTTPALTEVGSSPILGLSFTESQLGGTYTIEGDDTLEKDAEETISLSSFGAHSGSPIETYPLPTRKVVESLPSTSRRKDRGKKNEKKKVYVAAGSQYSPVSPRKPQIRTFDFSCQTQALSPDRKSSKSYHSKQSQSATKHLLSSSLALSSHVSSTRLGSRDRDKGKSRDSSKSGHLQDAWTQVDGGPSPSHPKRSHDPPSSPRDRRTSHSHKHRSRSRHHHTPHTHHASHAGGGGPSLSEHIQYSDFYLSSSSAITSPGHTPPVRSSTKHTSPARDYSSRPVEYVTVPVSPTDGGGGGGGYGGRKGGVTSAPLMNSTPAPHQSPIVFPSATVSPVRSHVFSMYSSPERGSSTPIRQHVVMPSATLSVSPVHSHRLSSPLPSPKRGDAHRQVFIYRHPMTTPSERHGGRAGSHRRAPLVSDPRPGSSPEEDKYTRGRGRRDRHSQHYRTYPDHLPHPVHQENSSRAPNSDGVIEGAHDLAAGRDPLLVVNIHKPTERGEGGGETGEGEKEGGGGLLIVCMW